METIKQIEDFIESLRLKYDARAKEIGLKCWVVMFEKWMNDNTRWVVTLGKDTLVCGQGIGKTPDEAFKLAFEQAKQAVSHEQ